MRYEKLAFREIPDADGDSQPLKVADLKDKWVQVHTEDMIATLKGTINGAQWLDIAAVAASSDLAIEVPEAFDLVKVTISAYVSGSATAVLAGRDTRTDG